MTDNETAAESGNGASETPEDKPEETSPPKKKKPAKRKSVWVCIPVEYEEVAVTDPESGALTAQRQPTKYAIIECPGGEGQTKAMRDALMKHEIDPLNYDDVIMLRADPLKFEIGTQLIIRVK